jgi:TrmH family RNA methyltransferase
MKSISSDSNPNFRRWLRLADSPRAVREQGSTLAEGLHLAGAIADAGVAVGAVLVRRGASEGAIPALLDRLGGEAIAFELAAPLYDRLSPVEHGAGLMVVIGIAQREAPRRRDEDLVYLDGIQDPGNAGAILRCAAAAGIRCVLASPGTAALWAPRTLRASMGAHFRLELQEGVSAQSLGDALGGDWYAAVAHEGESLWKVAFPSAPMGWIFGSEGAGPGEGALAAARQKVRIPTSGAVESLNVAAAAAVCMFERVRRRA